MLRTHTCGELNLADVGKTVTLCGWLQRSRDLGGMTFIDLRDRYGTTQLVFNIEKNKTLCEKARTLGREFVLRVSGKVAERSNKNPKIPTGDIEIIVEWMEILNESRIPPFTIEDDTDGGDELRMKYRYLDLRRKPVQQNLLQRHKVAEAVREYLDANGFVDVETPFLIKSTPEGARDFVVPSRLNPGKFYALPQSPQIFKQLLMVSGFDRYYQIVRCFRDEDLRADRQPEFTQIDCEMSFIEQEDVLDMFEGMIKHIFKKVRRIELPPFKRMKYEEAIMYYGTDKPDLRFDMKFTYLKNAPHTCALLEHDDKNTGFRVFNDAEVVIGICAKGCAEYSRKQLDELTEFVKRPQIGAGGLAYLKVNADGSVKSSLDKFYSAERLKAISELFEASPGDLILILAGEKNKTRKALSELRLEMGTRLKLRDKNKFECLWIIDFPLLEWNEEEKRWFAMHHPFTSPKKEDLGLFNALTRKDGYYVTVPRANAYDMVINGVEVGGGSIRIHKREMQQQMFRILGLSKEETEQKFGFILNAFEYGAPPHGGIAFGFDRLCSMVINNEDFIRDYIAFPKNNAGRDVMLDSPSDIDDRLKKELGL